MFVRYGGVPNKNHTRSKYNPKAREILSIVMVPRDEMWWPKYGATIERFIEDVLEFKKKNRGD